MDLKAASELLGWNLSVVLQFRRIYEQEHRWFRNLAHLEQALSLVSPLLERHGVADSWAREAALEATIFKNFVLSSTPVPWGLNKSLSIAEYMSFASKSLPFSKGTPFGENTDTVDYERTVIEAINATSYHQQTQLYLSVVSQVVVDIDLYLFLQSESSGRVLEELVGIYGTEAAIGGYRTLIEKLSERAQLFYLAKEWEEDARKEIDNIRLLEVFI